MTSPFILQTTPRFEREYRKLLTRHPDLHDLRPKVEQVLTSDPYNREGRHHIKKLVDLDVWRLRAGRFRFLYDIDGPLVTLHRCALRSEDTYR